MIVPDNLELSEKLKIYLTIHRMTIEDLAKKLDCTRGYLSNIFHGHVKCGRRLARDIEKETSGDIKAEELLAQPIKIKG